MEIIFENNSAIIKNLSCFEPQQIFDNGQAFRFIEVDGAYEGVAFGRFLRVSKAGDTVTLYPCEEREFYDIWYKYFDLERDYAALFPGCEDAALRDGRGYACGLRMLRQEPFETLISFIVSANNNIKRIRGIIDKICTRYGSPFSFEGKTYHAFPTPEQLSHATEQELTECGSGYRAPYILATAKEIAAGYDLEAVYGMEYIPAKKELTRFMGVGPKVADCVLLFAYSKTEAFPADVWIKRVMKLLYDFEGNDRQIFDFAYEKFGECAGIAQQYLFYYARENKLS